VCGTEVGAAAGCNKSRVIPDLVAVVVEDLTDKWVVQVKVDFAGSNNVCADRAHVAKTVENVQAVVTKVESIYILEINTEEVIRFSFLHFGAPMMV
jgi:hypothetical protein